MVETSAERFEGGRPGAEADLANARAAIRRHDLEAAVPLFRRLRGTALQAEGDYGLGWIAKERGRLEDAERYFMRALEFDSRHAHAYWQLGRLALGRNARSEAETLFRMAVDAQPGHAAARRELAKLGALPADDLGAPDAPAGTAASHAEAGPASVDLDGPFGVYEYLRKDRSHLSRQAVALLDRMQIDRYPPTYLSFFGFGLPDGKRAQQLLMNLLVALIAVVVIGSIALVLLRPAPVPSPTPPELLPLQSMQDVLSGLARFLGQLVLVVYVAAVLFVLARFLRHITTRIRIERGRLQIERGLLTRSKTNLELWRVHNVTLERRGLHRLTGDGSLVFQETAASQPITVTGLARGDDLDRLYEQLLDLVFLLRTNPSIKGIVQ